MSTIELKELTSDNKPRCQAITISRKQCSRAAEPNSEFCWQHQPKPEVKETQIQYTVLPQNRFSLGPLELQLKNPNFFTEDDNKQLINLVSHQVGPPLILGKEVIDQINDLTYPFYLIFKEAKTKEELINLVNKTYPPGIAKNVSFSIRHENGSIKGNINLIPVEYIIAEILQQAGEVVEVQDKYTLTYYTINYAIYKDPELKKLFKKNEGSTKLFLDYNPKIEQFIGRNNTFSKIYTKTIKPNGLIFTGSQYSMKKILITYLINTYFKYTEDQSSALGYTTPLTYFSAYIVKYKNELTKIKSSKDMIDFLLAHNLIQQQYNEYCSNVTNIMEENIVRQVCENIVTKYL